MSYQLLDKYKILSSIAPHIITSQYQTLRKAGAQVLFDTNTHRTNTDFKNELDTVYKQKLQLLGMRILARAMYYTPVDKGKLKRSYSIDWCDSQHSAVKIVNTCEYSHHVHEIAFYSHKYPTRYKFLEQAALEVAQDSGTDIPIKFSLEPGHISVYIGDYDKGVSVVDLNNTKNRLISDTALIQELEADMYNIIFSSQFENTPKEFRPFLVNFTKFWSGSEGGIMPERSAELVSEMDLAKNFLDRIRHFVYYDNNTGG